MPHSSFMAHKASSLSDDTELTEYQACTEGRSDGTEDTSECDDDNDDEVLYE